MKKESNITKASNEINTLLQTVPLWKTLESGDGERTLKQHAFIPKYNGRYNDYRNISLCGKIREGNDWGMSRLISEMWDEGSEIVNEEKACKRCLLISEKRHCL